MKYIKRLRHIFAHLIWTLPVFYLILVSLLAIPAVQESVGNRVSGAISAKLGTKTFVGRVNLGLLNRIIIDDVAIRDKQNRRMFQCHRLSAKINVYDLLNGRISISSAQLFGLKAMIVKETAKSSLNCQFVIDSLKSKDTLTHTPLDLHIASLVIRNSSASYDRLDVPRTSSRFNVNHLKFSKISGHIMLNVLTDDSLSVKLKKLSFIEENTGIQLRKMTVEAFGNASTLNVPVLVVETRNSILNIVASLGLNAGKIISYGLRISNSIVSTLDCACFIPELKNISKNIELSADISGTDNALNINSFNIDSSDKSLIAKIKGKAHGFTPLSWDVNVEKIRCLSSTVSPVLVSFGQDGLAKIFNSLEYVEYVGKATGSSDGIKESGILRSSIGDLSSEISYCAGHLQADVKSDRLELGLLPGFSEFGNTSLKISTTADINSGSSIRDLNLQFEAPLFTFKGYPYRNVSISAKQSGDDLMAKADIADTNADISVRTLLTRFQSLLEKNINGSGINIEAEVRHINPNTLGLIKLWPSTAFSFSTSVSVGSFRDILANISADVNNFTMKSAEKQYSFDSFNFVSQTDANGRRSMEVNSDFAFVRVGGFFDVNTLQQSLSNMLVSKLPTFPGIPPVREQHNNISIDATVYDTEILQKMFGVDLSISRNVTLNGYLNDTNRMMDLTIKSPVFEYSGMKFRDTNLHVYCLGDTLMLYGSTLKQDTKGKHLALQLEGTASDNRLQTALLWDNGNGNELNGSVNASAHFVENDEGKSVAYIDIMPSQIMLQDTLWTMQSSRIVYSDKYLEVKNFALTHEDQHLLIDGCVTESQNDSLTVNLGDVNVGYVMSLVNFHSVEFDGKASGMAVAKGLFSKPEAYADLVVDDFTFQEGRMGQLHALAKWNNDIQQIDIDAISQDSPGRTLINGYVNIKQNYIDLAIKAEKTRIEFMESFCSSFMKDVDANCDGAVRLYGDLKTIQLTGELVANGKLGIIPLNTTYTLSNDTVRLVPNDIKFVSDTIYDEHRNIAIVNGGLHHRYLGRMTFDLDIVAKHLLSFNFPDLQGSNFGGKVIASGNCTIKGRANEIIFDIEAMPEDGSEIIYNVSSPDALQNQDFITWRDRSILVDGNESADSVPGADIPASATGLRTNIHLNFLIHATPASTIRLIMDERTGDKITLNGEGTLRANYYNKGALQIYGNYVVDHGKYDMTIQNVITKDFDFLKGGVVAFGGDPFEASLNLQAQHVVNGVSLSDLNIGNSFANNSVRVNCLMNITGTPGQPRVDFDFNLPQASSDVQQMINSIVESEDKRNQQVIYLLTIGRFYAAGNKAEESTQMSKTSLAMQSLLSGTVSQQLNSVISDVMKSNDWSFGANISPGDEGMNNAEYEGIVSGKMLNNRLLINGQFGYRDNIYATSSFIGDFDIRYLLFPNGNLSVRVYNQTSDRYFTKSALNTQGIGIILKHEFTRLRPFWWKNK